MNTMRLSAQRVIVGLILILALFLGTTFGTRLPVLLATTVSGFIVFMRLRSRSRSEETTSYQLHRSTTRSRWLTRLAVIVCMLAVAFLVGAWRLSNQVGESINIVYVGVEIGAHVCMFAILLAWMMRPQRGHVSMLPCGLLIVLLCVAGGGASMSYASQITVAIAACLGFATASQVLLGARRGTGGYLFALPSGGMRTGTRSEIFFEGAAESAGVTEGDKDGHRWATQRNEDSSDEIPGTESRQPSRLSLRDLLRGDLWRDSANWIGPVFSLLALSVLMMATSAIAEATNLVLPTIQNKLQQQLEKSFDSVPDQSIVGGTRYVSGTLLGSIRRHMLGSPQDIALRVQADYPPGYLRGSVFDLYGRRRWFSSGDGSQAMRVMADKMPDRVVQPSEAASVSVAKSGTRKRFQLMEKTNDRTIHLKIHNEPLKGNKIFLPLNTRWVEAVSSELTVSPHHVVRHGIDVTHPYVAGVGATRPRERLSEGARDVLLAVPPDLTTELDRIVDATCATLDAPRDKAAAVSRFFQANFDYSLKGVERPRRVDPVKFFLATRHAAHCEYFATSTALVLRRAGVPTRYVTGYVADSYDEEWDGYVARNRDAHAWVEAYDDRRRQWFPVESTPGRTYHSVDLSKPPQVSDSFFDVFRQTDDGDETSRLSRLIGWFMALRATDPLYFIFRLLQLPLFCVLVFFLWSRYFRRKSIDDSALDLRCRKLLRQVDRQMRKYSLVRRRGETLFQFADRIETTRQSELKLKRETRDKLDRAARWYRDYATARYQGQEAPGLE